MKRASILSLRGSVVSIKPMDISKMEKLFRKYMGARRQKVKKIGIKNK